MFEEYQTPPTGTWWSNAARTIIKDESEWTEVVRSVLKLAGIGRPTDMQETNSVYVEPSEHLQSLQAIV